MHNIRSIKNKFNELEIIIKLHDPDIIALIETWLSPNEESIYNLGNYNAEYISRDTRGGGLALYIKKISIIKQIQKKILKE